MGWKPGKRFKGGGTVAAPGRVSGRQLPGNGHPVTVWAYEADVHARRIASLGAYTNTFSPAALGVHSWPDASPTGYTGDPGFGVNRWAGKLPFPVQNFIGLVAPINHAKNKRLGANAGASGQPGLPSTGDSLDASMGYPFTAGWGF